MEYASQMSIIHEEEKPTQQESKKKKDNPLTAFFRKAFSGNNHDDFTNPTDESTVTTSTEENIPFVIMGTSVDDPAAVSAICNPTGQLLVEIQSIAQCELHDNEGLHTTKEQNFMVLIVVVSRSMFLFLCYSTPHREPYFKTFAARA